MCRLVEDFVKIVFEKDHFPKKYLKKWTVTENEKKDFEYLLDFYIRQYHYTLDYLTESYLFLNSMMIEEQRFFLKHGRYRNCTFKEVNKNVYQNQAYMELNKKILPKTHVMIIIALQRGSWILSVRKPCPSPMPTYGNSFST